MADDTKKSSKSTDKEKESTRRPIDYYWHTTRYTLALTGAWWPALLFPLALAIGQPALLILAAVALALFLWNFPEVARTTFQHRFLHHARTNPEARKRYGHVRTFTITGPYVGPREHWRLHREYPHAVPYKTAELVTRQPDDDITKDWRPTVAAYGCKHNGFARGIAQQGAIDPNQTLVRFTSAAFPDRVASTPDPSLYRNRVLPPAYVLAHRPHRYLGISELGDPVIHDRGFTANLMVSGRTRSGKGGVLKTLIPQDVTAGEQVYLIAPDPGEFGLFADHIVRVDELGAVDLIDWLVEEESTRRRALLDETINPATGMAGVKDLASLPAEIRPPPISLFIDEAPSILGKEAALVYPRPVADKLFDGIAHLGKRGAKLGLYATVSTQYPTIGGTFGGGGDKGGGVKNQLGGRLHFDRNTESLRAAFDSGSMPDEDSIANLSRGLAGRALYSKLNPIDRDAVVGVQVHWLEDAEALALLGPAPADLKVAA